MVHRETASVEDGKWQCTVSGKEEGGASCHSPETAKGNPIKITTGNKYQTETDYIGGGIFPLRISRTYNSISGAWQFFLKSGLPPVRMNCMWFDRMAKNTGLLPTIRAAGARIRM